AGVAGYLKTQTVDIGDRVRKGQVLATIAVPELEKQVKQYTKALAQACARVSQMKAHVAYARAELKTAEAAIVQAEANRKSACAPGRFREKQLKRMRDLYASRSIDERLVDESEERCEAALEAEHAATAAVSTANAQKASALAKIEQAEADVVEAEAQVEVAQAQ